MAPKAARTVQHDADLSGTWARQTAERWFGPDAIASLPVRKSGPHKGHPIGALVWMTTIEAGWHPCSGPIGAQMMVRAWIGRSRYSGESDALTGHWYGRPQPLCGSRALLSQEARDRDAAERERDRAEMEAALAAREARRGAP